MSDTPHLARSAMPLESCQTMRFGFIAASLLLLYALVCLAAFVYQRSLLYAPQPRAVTAAESTLHLTVPGADLVVTTRPHAGPKALLYFGGNAEDVSQNLPSFAAAFPDHALFLLHYRGYGGSTGSPSESANVSDAVALFQAVYAQYPQVALVGRSLGSGVAVQLASQVAATRLILVTPYDSITHIAEEQFPYLPVKWLLLDRYESTRYAPRIKLPTTLIEAQNDQLIPHASTDRLLAQFQPGVASLVTIAGAGHNDIDARPDYVAAMQAALR